MNDILGLYIHGKFCKMGARYILKLIKKRDIIGTNKEKKSKLNWEFCYGQLIYIHESATFKELPSL